MSSFWSFRPSEVVHGFWLARINMHGAGTHVMVMDDFGNLVSVDFGALAVSVANGA